MDYQTLLDQQKYEEAAIELERQIAISPDDEKRSKLARCLAIIGSAEEALTVTKQIEHPTAKDDELVAIIHWQLENWDEMESVLRATVGKSPSPEVYRLLAIAEGRGRAIWQIDKASKEIMRGFLCKATESDNCQVEAFLLLAQIEDFEQTGKSFDVLFKALEKFPGNPNVRTELANVLIYENRQYDRAIEVVTPLFGNTEWAKEARWYAFDAFVHQEKYIEASQNLDAMQIEESTVRERINADLLFRQRKFSEWLVKSEEYVADDDPDSVRKHFRKAYVNLNHNDVNKAIDDFAKGANLLLENQTSLDPNISVRIGTHSFMYVEFDVISDVCETLLLLQSESPQITENVLGLLAYTVDTCCFGQRQNEMLAFFPQHSGSLTSYAAKLLDFPASLGDQVAWEILDDDPVGALGQFFAHSIWAQESDNDFLQA